MNALSSFPGPLIIPFIASDKPDFLPLVLVAEAASKAFSSKLSPLVDGGFVLLLIRRRRRFVGLLGSSADIFGLLRSGSSPGKIKGAPIWSPGWIGYGVDGFRNAPETSTV
jgi:hypothetical protein